MKRLLTYLSAIIIMMMVPIGVSAWTSIYLRGGSYDWESNSSGSEFKKWDDNNFVKAVTPSTTGDYYFRYYVNNDGGFQCGPDDDANDRLLTVNGPDLTATKGKAKKAFYFAATAGETYYISVRYVSSTWKVSVSNKPIVRIGGCIGGQNYSWDNDKAAYMAYDSTEDAWYYDVSASDFSSWKRSGDGLIGLDFRFREVNGEQLYYVFSTGSENNAHTTLTSTYQELASNTSGADSRFVGVEEVANATNYRVWYKNDNGTRKAKVEVTTSAPVTTTATLTIGGTNITGSNSGSNYYFDIPADKYTAGSPMEFTLKTVTGGTATYYTGNFTGTASGNAFKYTTSTSEGTMSYSVPSDATGLIRVSLLTGTNEVVFAYTPSGGGGTSTGYYLIGDLNCFARPYTDTSWTTQNWTTYGAVNKVMQFHDNGDGTYSLRIPASRPSSDDSTWDKPVNEKGSGTSQFVIAPEAAFSGTEYSGDLFSVSNWNNWSGLTLDWSQVLRPQDNSSLNNAAISSGTMAASGSSNWSVYNNGGSYTITINPTAGTFSVTNDNTTHVMYVITKQDGHWRNSYLTDVTSDQNTAYNHRHGDNTSTGELSEFPNEDGATVYIAHNWHEQGSNKNFTTNQHLNIFGAWNDNGDLAPVTWIAAKSGATAKSIFPTAGNYSTNIDPTTGRTDGVDGKTQYSSVISSNNDPSTGNITGKKGNEALIDPDATLTPGTTTWDSYTLDDTKALTVTLTNGATGYKYSYGAGTTPSTSGTSTTFGNLSYDGTDVKLNGTTVASGNTVTICIQGTDGNNDGAVHEYTYTFNPTATVTTTINTAGGLYINKVLVDVAYTGDSSTPLYWKVGGAPTTSDNLVSYTDDENNVSNRKFLLSTPGQLYVGNGTNTSAPVTFDFTYSTSENYVGVEKNGTVSQIVTSKGGKDCVNVFFKKSEDNMSIYVWDAYAEPGSEYLTKVWPGQWMSDDRTLTLNGETFYYVSFPTSDLVKNDDNKYKIGFILSNAALGSSDTDADKTKTRDYFLEFDATDTDVQGVQETMFYAIEANVQANKVFDPEGSTYESQEKSTYKGSAAQLFSNNTVYFKNDANWTSPIYCHVWKADETKLHEWQSNGEMMTLVDAENNIYAYTIPSDYQYKLAFTSKTNNSDVKTGDLTFSGNGGRMYTVSTSSSYWDDAPSSFTTLDAASQTVMNTFLETPPVTTVESRVYPNGQDYYRNMPNDYTLMLSNEWKHETEPVDEQSWQKTSGSHWSGSTTKKYLHIRDNTAYQTVKNLPAGTYTVQTLVRGGAELVYLKLNNTQVTSIRLTTDGADAKTTINKFGRSEQLVEMSTDNGKRGWHKLEGTVKLETAGDLKIAVSTNNGGSIDLADVFLLKDANTAGNYWTTAPTSETDTECDMSNRTNYNAFSFFDRGKNLNSIIKANQKTVIGMSEDNERYLTGDEKGARRHPCNVVTSSDGGTTWHTPMLALTDYASVIVGSENKYGGNPLVSQHAYGTSFAYTADKFSYDRATSAKMMSTMLPFALSNDQVKSMLGSGVKTYIYGGANKTTYKVTFSETSSELAANTPFFFRPVEAKTSMVLNQSVSVPATPAAAALAEGIVGTYKHTSDVGTYYKNKNFIPYFFQDGNFVWAQDNANAKPFRVVFLLGKDNEARVLNVIFEEDAVTAIDGIAETNIDAAPVYSVDGKLVSSNGDISHLTKGVYVKAGKKFIIK